MQSGQKEEYLFSGGFDTEIEARSTIETFSKALAGAQIPHEIELEIPDECAPIVFAYPV